MTGALPSLRERRNTPRYCALRAVTSPASWVLGQFENRKPWPRRNL